LLPLIERVPVEHRHPMPVEAADGDRRYASELRDVTGTPPILDVVHLGLGADGHTASLVPGDPSVDIVDQDVCWADEYQGHRRLTLSLPVLAAARHQMWLVTGSGKASAVRELCAGTSDSPAARVAGNGAPTVFLDVDAAALTGLA
jgi:6-phosphogluconolactonase/glucosamine-6-phosphate isomerase/deaminase